jgi:hypothetical protein
VRWAGRAYKENCLKILIYSRAFWPSVGGLETVMEILAEEFTAAGQSGEGGLNPHSPDIVLNFGAAFAIQI